MSPTTIFGLSLAAILVAVLGVLGTNLFNQFAQDFNDARNDCAGEPTCVSIVND